jgi:hypothetical protein
MRVMKPGQPLSLRDWLAATALFAASLALRVPFRSHLAYHWDAAQFALAINDYNVALSQPQAPGYFLYVMFGRLVNFFVGDPHASLVWISVVFGGALVALLYVLGVAMFGRRTGIAAALFAMTSPQTWFHSEVALTYVVDAVLVCVTVLWCWRAIRRGGTWGDAIVIGALLALAGGVRQQTAPALVPLVLYTFWQFDRQRVAKLVVAALVAIVVGIAWLLPMVQMSGGLATYLEVLRRVSAITASQKMMGGGWSAFQWNVTLVTIYCWNGLLLGVVLLIAGLLYRTFTVNVERKRAWDREHRQALWVLTLWIAPMIMLGTAVLFTEQPGHVLSYLPAWLLLAAVVAAQLRKRGAFVVTVAAVSVINAAAFLVWPTAWDGVLFGVGRTAREIRQHDRQLAETIRVMRAKFDPQQTVVCHPVAAHYLFGLRLFQLHAPEFEHYQMQIDPTIISPPGKPMLAARGGRTLLVAGLDRTGKRIALLVVPPGLSVDVFRSYFDVRRTELVGGTDGTLYALPLAQDSDEPPG